MIDSFWRLGYTPRITTTPQSPSLFYILTVLEFVLYPAFNA